MKALIICPSPRPAIALLSETAPLAIVPLLGKSLIEYWIEYLVGKGVRNIRVLAADRASVIEAFIGDGTRWGIAIYVEPELHESSVIKATKLVNIEKQNEHDFIIQMDHLPGQAERHLFYSYANWFAGLNAWISLAQSIERIGQYEIDPGVWVGLRPRIHTSARLLPPCWIGDHVSINKDTIIGPGTIIESGVIVGAGSHITQSIIGPATFVGVETRIENSIAYRHILINWVTNSCLKVPDACWLSSLRGPIGEPFDTVLQGPMQLKNDGHTLHVANLEELSASNSTHFMDAIRESIVSAVTVTIIEIDLQCTRFMDSCGLATLCSLQRLTQPRGIRLRLLAPRPAMQQLLELTKLHELFEIDPSYQRSDTVTSPMISRAQSLIGMSTPKIPQY